MFDRKEEGRSGMVLELNPEQKQRVNLSLHAQEILEADREQFAPHLTKNGFFNELLYRFAPQAGASISQTLERRRQTILLQLENLKIQKKKLDPETAEAVTEALLSPVRKELEMKAASYPKGTSVLFRLSNRNSVLFYDPDWPDAAFYRNKPARYMKALIEEYASHTQYQREAFYFNEWISHAEAAAAAGKLLRITTQNPRGEETSWDLRVYGILPNEAGIFHYLVGRCVLKGGLKSEENIASFRLSRLVDVRILSSSGIRSGSLSSSEKKEIEEKIAHGRVQFLIGEKQECVVRLTQKGKQMYKAIQYMKPLPSEIDEDGNYHFECSTYQILQYFYRFGGQAQVLQPQSLRELLREEYRKAYEAYEGESPESDNE